MSDRDEIFAVFNPRHVLLALGEEDVAKGLAEREQQAVQRLIDIDLEKKRRLKVARMRKEIRDLWGY